MRIASAFVCLLASIVLGCSSAAAISVDRIEGSVSPSTLPKFADLIANHLDQIVGLKVAVEAVDQADMVAHANGQFAVWVPGGDFEIVASRGFSYQHGAYVFDGYFLVKSGGMHQGVLSYGLEQVDEAQVLLTPDIKFNVINVD